MNDSMINTPLIVVIILNYNSLEDTTCCVESVRQSTYGNYRILVIDNASPDGSGEQLARLLPAREFLALSANTGYAGGNNIGMSLALEADASYILILNPDIRLTTDAISEYVNVMEHNPDIGILSPLQLQQFGGAVDEKFEHSILKPHGYDSLIHDVSQNGLLNVSRVLGAVMMLRAETLRRVGGFDPLFFAYGEEEDFCRRTLIKGFRIAVTLAAPVAHLRTKEKHAVSGSILFLRTKGAYLLSMKNPHFNFITASVGVLGYALRDLLIMTRNRYPFSYYPVNRWHVFLSIIWLTIHLPNIFLHRRRESMDAPYLDVNYFNKGHSLNG